MTGLLPTSCSLFRRSSLLGSRATRPPRADDRSRGASLLTLPHPHAVSQLVAQHPEAAMAQQHWTRALQTDPSRVAPRSAPPGRAGQNRAQASWRETPYEVNEGTSSTNANWFSVQEFLDLLGPTV